MKINEIAASMVSKGKGILAADESTGTMTKRLSGVKIESNEKNRLAFRHTLFTSKSINKYISGVILYDETIRQSKDGKTIGEILNKQNILPGIKVDKGAKKLVGSDESVTEGLDGLRERLKEYYELGAKFTKWRAVINIGEDMPSSEAISANMEALADYAKIVQNNNMVPMVEPEVLMDGNHSIDDCFEATSRCLDALFTYLLEKGVDIKGTILKPNMVTSGSNYSDQADVEEVARKTIDCLKAYVPDDLPGITFLSGGQSDIDATAHLDAMNKIGGFNWKLSFSYGRALQQPALKAWMGKIENSTLAQQALSHRALMNKLASEGKWDISLEN